MNAWANQSGHFVYWLSKQKNSALYPKEVQTITAIGDLDNSDLISMMFYGEGFAATEALFHLKERFYREMDFLNDLSQNQGRDN
jgi:hypothetical protein